MHCIPPEDPLLTTAALEMAQRGWPVFPLRPGDKRPAVRDWERRATTDAERVRRCWEHAAYNIGVAAGPAGLVIIDLDTAKSEAAPHEWRIDGVQCGEDALAVLAERSGHSFAGLMYTYAVRTASGGLHLYYAAPSDIELRNSAGKLGWLIDSRAAGGYVVGAGSTVTGRTYELINDSEPAPLPSWLAELLADQPISPMRPERALAIALAGADRRTAYANRALTAELGRVLAAVEGTRNDTLVKAAFALGQLVGDGLLPEVVVTDALAAAGQAIGLPIRECAATIRSGLRSGIARPRGGAA